jgi:hypothetical protein
VLAGGVEVDVPQAVTHSRVQVDSEEHLGDQGYKLFPTPEPILRSRVTAPAV